MKEPPQSPADLQDDPDAHGTRRLRQVPDEYRTRDDEHLSPLQGEQGHGVAHAGILSGVEVAPLQLTSRHRREIGPFDNRGGDAERAAGVRGSPFLLRASYLS